MSLDLDFPHTAADVAAKLRCHRQTVLRRARRLGLGIDLEGSAGMRFSDRDIEQLVAALRPAPPSSAPPRRKRRRRGVAA